MNILYLVPYVPSLKANHAGGAAMGKELEELRKHHHVTVLCFIQDPYEYELAEKEPDADRVFYPVSTLQKAAAACTHPGMPAFFAIRAIPGFLKKAEELIREKNIQAVHAEFTAMGQFAEPLKRTFPHLIFHLVLHDVTAQSYERQVNAAAGLKKAVLKAQLRAVKKCENDYIRHCDRVIVFNEKDRKLLKDYYGVTEAEVINTYFSIPEERTGEGKDLCFLGAMNREENEEAALRLISLYNRLPPSEAELYIIGAKPSEHLQSMGTERIHITGFVENPDEYMAKAIIAVFPLKRGAGIKVKVLNALAMGIPVITTDVGAEAIDEEGKALVLANTDEEILAWIQRLAESPELRREISQKERQLIADRFSWEKTEKVFLKLYDHH